MPAAVAAMRPLLFVFENVPGILSGEDEGYARALIDDLRNCAGTGSYGVAMGVLNAADFGVPQIRRRVFVVGAAGREATWTFYVSLTEYTRERRTPTRVCRHRGNCSLGRRSIKRFPTGMNRSVSGIGGLRQRNGATMAVR